MVTISSFISYILLLYFTYSTLPSFIFLRYGTQLANLQYKWVMDRQTDGWTDRHTYRQTDNHTNLNFSVQCVNQISLVRAWESTAIYTHMKQYEFIHWKSKGMNSKYFCLIERVLS